MGEVNPTVLRQCWRIAAQEMFRRWAHRPWSWQTWCMAWEAWGNSYDMRPPTCWSTGVKLVEVEEVVA